MAENNDQPNVFVSRHPLVQAKLSIMRNKQSDCMLFRELTNELSLLLGYEATADLQTRSLGVKQETDFGVYDPVTLNDSVALIPVMRAGLGLLAPFQTLLPTAACFHLGIFRDPVTKQPVEYYNRLPVECRHQVAIILDAMLATGGTVMSVIKQVKEWGGDGLRSIKVVCLCASKQAIDRITKAYPSVQVYTAAIDDEVNADGYIVPGLGDAGDRMYRTK